MMGACVRKGVMAGVGVSAVLVAIIPACLLLLWVAMGCLWMVGLVSAIKLLWRLLWRISGGGDSKRDEEAKKRRSKKKLALKEEAAAAESARMKLSLVHQYLEDQLSALAPQLLHVPNSDSMPSSYVDIPLHVDSCNNWTALDDEGECVQAH